MDYKHKLPLIAILTAFLFLVEFVKAHEGHEGHEHEPDEDPWPESHKIIMEKDTGVKLRWSIDHTEKWITMEMSSFTSGYVAIGFCSPWEASMKGCDIVIGWVQEDGTPKLYDYHATENAAPILDQSQDYILLNATQNEYQTIIKFKRKWTTGDANDLDLKEASRNNDVRIMYAWHPMDPDSEENIPAHDRSTRGHTLKSISLMNPPEHNTASSKHILHLGPLKYFAVLLFFIHKFNW